jgi:hypothetical protein
MKANERVLSVLRTQAQFEVAQSSLEVAQAASRSAQAEEQASSCERNVTAIANELEGTLQRKAIDPAWLDSMQRVYRGQRRAWVEMKARLATAQQREQQARAALAQLRHRERSLERAAHSERQRQQRELDAREMIRIDEMWLQHSHAAGLEDGRAHDEQIIQERAFATARVSERAVMHERLHSLTRGRERAAMPGPA